MAFRWLSNVAFWGAVGLAVTYLVTAVLAFALAAVLALLVDRMAR